jgi:signal transduction histidine kinase
LVCGGQAAAEVNEMMERCISLLLIEDDPADAYLLREMLRERRQLSFEVEWANRLRLGLEHLDAGQFDVVLLDLTLPDSAGLETLAAAHARAPGVPIVVLSGIEDEAIAIQAVREGAQDYLVKGRVDGNLVVRAIRYAIERQRAEDRIRHYAAELQQRNEEVRQFAYIVSHDLRGPLVSLKGFVKELGFSLEVIGAAMETVWPHLDEEQQSAVACALREDAPEAMVFINASADRMGALVDAVLRLSRLGRRELTCEAIDMNSLVQASLDALAHQLEDGDVEVTVGPLPEVVADRTAMGQVVGNLLNNAVMYLEPGRPGKIEVSGERAGNGATFHVRDNGRGIAERDRDKVFTPFRRAGKEDVPGEGMGLAYVQTLIRRHGGRIWFESEPGQGSTFHFTVEAREASPE